ncbi:hypothetical protein AYI68_g7610 [Smittium mucronatum]|uniref:Uncharacterized protein n=1 Tax=Smittium mucronatum TaxID=133383 RepID=A0A1R0GN98_9FUNG|nr:hypothetical protein AYI68_g7610 [Smittium mucronatum]
MFTKKHSEKGKERAVDSMIGPDDEARIFSMEVECDLYGNGSIQFQNSQTHVTDNGNLSCGVNLSSRDIENGSEPSCSYSNTAKNPQISENLFGINQVKNNGLEASEIPRGACISKKRYLSPGPIGLGVERKSSRKTARSYSHNMVSSSKKFSGGYPVVSTINLPDRSQTNPRELRNITGRSFRLPNPIITAKSLPLNRVVANYFEEFETIPPKKKSVARGINNSKLNNKSFPSNSKHKKDAIKCSEAEEGSKKSGSPVNSNNKKNNRKCLKGKSGKVITGESEINSILEEIILAKKERILPNLSRVTYCDPGYSSIEKEGYKPNRCTNTSINFSPMNNVIGELCDSFNETLINSQTPLSSQMIPRGRSDNRSGLGLGCGHPRYPPGIIQTIPGTNFMVHVKPGINTPPTDVSGNVLSQYRRVSNFPSNDLEFSRYMVSKISSTEKAFQDQEMDGGEFIRRYIHLQPKSINPNQEPHNDCIFCINGQSSSNHSCYIQGNQSNLDVSGGYKNENIIQTHIPHALRIVTPIFGTSTGPINHSEYMRSMRNFSVQQGVIRNFNSSQINRNVRPLSKSKSDPDINISNHSTSTFNMSRRSN